MSEKRPPMEGKHLSIPSPKRTANHLHPKVFHSEEWEVEAYLGASEGSLSSGKSLLGLAIHHL
jgi:hypothetical protein